MTQESLLDMVQMQFPEALETEVRQRLNDAVRLFSERTLMFHKTVNVTITASTTEYTLNASILRVDSVISGTTVFEQLTRRPENYTGDGTDYVYYLQGKTIHLGTMGNKGLGALTAGTVVNLHCRAKPETLGMYIALLDSSGNPVYDLNGDAMYVVASELTTEADIPTQFHIGIVYKVLSDLWLSKTTADPRDRIAMSREYERKWMKILRDAAAYGSRNHSGTGFNTQPHLY